jgi:hypothetical protein
MIIVVSNGSFARLVRNSLRRGLQCRARAVQCSGNRAKRTVATDRFFQITNLSLGGILTASAQEVTEEVLSDEAGTAAVEEGESLFVVCGGLVSVSHDVVYGCVWE